MILLVLQVKALTRWLSVADFGAWSQINVFIFFVNLLVSFNLGHGFIRFASSYATCDKETCFGSVLIFQFVAHLIALAAILPLRDVLMNFLSGAVSDSVFWAIASLLLITVVYNNIQNYLLVSGRELQVVRQNLLRLLVDVACICAGAYLAGRLWGALWGGVASAAFCVILFSWLNRIDYRKLTYSSAMIRQLLKFSLPLMSVTIAYWVISSSNKYIINAYLGLEAVGRFSVANRLPMMLVTIFTVLSTIFLSNVSRLYDAQNFDRVSHWFSFVIRWYWHLAVAGAAGLIGGSRALTLIVSTKEYLFDGLPFVYLTIALGSLCFGSFQIISRLYELEKAVYRSSCTWILSMLLNIGFNLLLIPRYGLVGGAVATCVSLLSAFLVGIYFRPRRIALSVPWLKLFVYTAVTLFLAWLYATAVENRYLPKIGWSILMSAAVSVAALALGFLIRLVTWTEIMELVRERKPSG